MLYEIGSDDRVVGLWRAFQLKFSGAASSLICGLVRSKVGIKWRKVWSKCAAGTGLDHSADFGFFLEALAPHWHRASRCDSMLIALLGSDDDSSSIDLLVRQLWDDLRVLEVAL